jgi:hypothetical protein
VVLDFFDYQYWTAAVLAVRSTLCAYIYNLINVVLFVIGFQLGRREEIYDTAGGITGIRQCHKNACIE